MARLFGASARRSRDRPLNAVSVGRLRLHQADFLLTCAEIAIAFAAFASLISIVGRREPGPAQRIAAHRLFCVLGLALLAAALCLVPFPISEFGYGQGATLRLSAGCIMLPEFIGTFVLVRRIPPGFYSQRFASALWIILGGVCALLLLAVVAGLVDDQQLSAIYLTLVVLHLVGVGQFFLLVVASVLLPDE